MLFVKPCSLLYHANARAYQRLFSRCPHRRYLSPGNDTVLVRPCTTRGVTCLKIHTRWLSHDALQSDDDLSDEEEDLVPEEVLDANTRCKGSLEILNINGQWGVHTTRTFTKGEIVISSNLKNNLTRPTATSCAHSIQIGWNRHILMNLPARYLNHSCSPNIGVLGLNADGSYDFAALKDIECNEELRFDYETTEFEIGAFSQCCCGSPCCRKSIHGYKYTSSIIRKKYNAEIIAPYLLAE